MVSESTTNEAESLRRSEERMQDRMNEGTEVYTVNFVIRAKPEVFNRWFEFVEAVLFSLKKADETTKSSGGFAQICID